MSFTKESLTFTKRAVLLVCNWAICRSSSFTSYVACFLAMVRPSLWVKTILQNLIILAYWLACLWTADILTTIESCTKAKRSLKAWASEQKEKWTWKRTKTRRIRWLQEGSSSVRLKLLSRCKEGCRNFFKSLVARMNGPSLSSKFQSSKHKMIR